MTERPTFEGVFEAHITVALPVDEDQFRDDCTQLGVKPIVIRLPLGATPVQPMTSAVYEGDLASALARSQGVWNELQMRGYVPTRLKLEAGPKNRDLPETDAAASRMPDEYYFEHHLKTLVSNEQQYNKLQAVCANHKAHVSSNASKHSTEGDREIFVTVRSYAVGRHTAEASIGALTDALHAADVTVLKRICEYCVYDSNVNVDDGWQ